MSGSLGARTHSLVPSARFVCPNVEYGPVEDERIVVQELLQGRPEVEPCLRECGAAPLRRENPQPALLFREPAVEK